MVCLHTENKREEGHIKQRNYSRMISSSFEKTSQYFRSLQIIVSLGNIW